MIWKHMFSLGLIILILILLLLHTFRMSLHPTHSHLLSKPLWGYQFTDASVRLYRQTVFLATLYPMPPYRTYIHHSFHSFPPNQCSIVPTTKQLCSVTKDPLQKDANINKKKLLTSFLEFSCSSMKQN